MATVFLVVCFAYIFATAPTTYAADADWSGNDIVYQQNTYADLGKATGLETHKLPKDTQIYQYVEAANTSGGGATQKAHLIYFPSGTDPTTATTASYQTYDLLGANLYSNPSQAKQLSLLPQPALASATTNPGASSCKVDGVGWIVCSMSRWIADGVDYLYGIISKFFIVQPLTSTSPTNSMYDLWQAVRNFANVAFVIAFLVIIYSQITSNAMSNYTIKKMVPRIIVAAILVNTSYWICAAAIDVSNILGIAIQDLFINLRGGVGAATFDMPKWQDVTAGILSGTGVVVGGAALLVATGGTIGGLVFLLLGALLPAIFAALVAVAILAARQAIITLFVIIAPLAFVAYLLPNTEDWFNRWRKLFMTALLMFPAFSLIFGAAQLAGVVIIQNAHGDISIALLGLTVQVVPLFVTPFLIKLSSGLLGTIAGMANDRSKGVFDRAKGWTNNNRELHRQRGFSTRPRQGVNRFRPTNVARGLNNRTLRREGMTAAHKAVAEGRFEQTAAGRRVHHRKKNAELYKHAGEADNQEAYNNAVYGTPGVPNSGSAYRGQLHHDTLTASGRAKLVEDRAVAHAERDLQTQINSTAALRDLKVHTDVDTAHAEFQKANVAAEGKAVFKREFEDGAIGGRALRLMNVQTSGFEKEAAAIESMLSKRADADWERRSNTDANVQRLRLKEVEASESYTRAEKEWQRTITRIQTEGSTASGIIAAGNVEVRAMADAIKVDTRASLIQDQAVESIKLVQKSDFANALKNNAALRAEAADIDPHGQVRVLAAAKKAVSEELIKATNNVYDTMEYDLATKPAKLEAAWHDAESRGEMSEIIAYARKLSMNAPGLRKLKPLLEQFTAGKDPLSDDVMLLKEVLAGDDTFRNAGRDLEVWANNEINPATDDPYTDFAQVRNAPIPYSNITASRFARMNAYSQEETLYWLQENKPENLRLLLEGIGDQNSQVWRELKGTTREQITNYRDGRRVTDPNRARSDEE